MTTCGVIILSLSTTALPAPKALLPAPLTPAGGPDPEIERFSDFRVEWHLEAQEASACLPGASVIIPTYNNAALVNACLEQLVATVPEWLDVEIIVMDDASECDTWAVLESWTVKDKRVKALRNPQNKGFLHTCNLGAAAATGEILVFLNNDTLPQPGWLSPLLRVMANYPQAGAVGGKLIYPDHTLQEAGGIIFSDAAGWNFGRYSSEIDEPLFNYFREVDYCSGALLATRRSLFLELGGFDAAFVPMYYEDVDYCFTLREKGYKVYYQPESVVIHLEGGTAGTDPSSGFKTWQVVNQARFAQKWQQALTRQPAHPAELTRSRTFDLAVRDEDRLI